jgi:hypothetical protein
MIGARRRTSPRCRLLVRQNQGFAVEPCGCGGGRRGHGKTQGVEKKRIANALKNAIQAADATAEIRNPICAER